MKNTNKVDYEHINNFCDGQGKGKLLSWLVLFICIFFYFTFNTMIARLALKDEYYYITILGYHINKNAFSGVVAQGQVISVVLITLNPLKRSSQTAMALCIITGILTLFNIITSNNINALPGVVISITSLSIVMIISKYGKNLKSQIRKVLEYSKILKENEEMLHQLAYYDTLTGLPNRKMMMDEIDMLTNPQLSERSDFVLVYMDLDDFKKINDLMGHSVGDAILKQIAFRWKIRCHQDDLIGRIGGDEFTVLIRHNISNSELLLYLEGFRAALAEVIIVERKEFYMKASFGVTKYPEDGNNAEELFKNADIALYKVKNLGKDDYRFFTREMQEEVIKRIRLENGLLTAVRDNELYIVFQPQYICGSKSLRGYEALVRWKHPEFGLINPADFIPITEETGIINTIGRWIIENTLQKFMEFKVKYNISTIVAINISVVQMLDPSFVYMIKEIIKKTGFDSRMLELEITESVFISYPDQIIEVIKQLKKMGIRIALDDFGTGYASLNYLQILPINVLKIDKTFIDKIISQHSHNQIVGTLISLSHQLGIEVVAEGVEREEQLKYLTEHKCDFIQGYLLSKPIEEEQIIQIHEFVQVC